MNRHWNTKEETYLLRFNSFFNSEKLSSTYKPVFIKSLIDISGYDEKNWRLAGHRWITKQDGKLQVDLNFIVIRYIYYFWQFHFKFKLKQSHSPGDANINKILGTLKKGPKVRTVSSLEGEEFSFLRKEVIKKSIKPEVLRHLDKQKDLYEIVFHKNYILLDYSIVPFFARYREILIAALNFMITRYLEKINFVPRIAEKVSVVGGKKVRKNLTNEEWQIILKMNNSCFYCNARTANRMDHVIPFNFIYQTEIFNIVPACFNCNSKKSDRLPLQEIFNKVKRRNSKLPTYLPQLREDYNEDWYQKLYESCAASYQGTSPYFFP